MKRVLDSLVGSSASLPALKAWALMAMGILGAGLSLERAKPLLSGRRTIKTLLTQSVALIESQTRFLTADTDDKELAEWLVGFHLNNAEHRLAAVYEQLLKTLLHVSKGNVPDLERKFRQRLGSTGLIGPFMQAAQAVRPIRKRTNDWKHNADPYVDSEDPTKRFDETHKALAVFVSFFQQAAINTLR